ncbi:MAG: hypothetical protein QNK37_31970 [Acidobacteriota bacterium]|nr:hypothetical protein [Acidobacteriota bacterium]
MKKLLLSIAAVCTLAFGGMQLVASSQSCDDCQNECADDYINCIVGGEDERACVADYYDCQLDCWDFYCN